MMRNIWFVIVVQLLFCASCSKDEGEKKAAPEFKSSIPENNAKEVELATSIEVVFDEVISLAENHNITINGKSADVNASLTKLVFTEELEYSTTYNIIIPGGAVVNTYNVSLANEIQITFSTKDEAVIEIDPNLVTENPSSEAVNVYNFLKESYGNKAISSSMANVNWNLNEAEWVKQHTGKYPAIANFDYNHLPYSPANWIDYSVTDFVEEWWSNNGLVGASWHWIVPTYEGSDKYTYIPDETTFKASNVTIDGTWENTIAKADLEKMAGYLKLLKEKNIPVIWRPLHEAAGNTYEYTGGTAWFWWGYDGADVYKDIWYFMFDYFKGQGLDNLIWVWTTQTKDEDFYPGDNYVDIIGRDIYNNSDATSIATEFKGIQEEYSNKIITLSELGNVANFSDQWSAGANWSYYMPWYDYNRTKDIESSDFTETDHEHANAAWWTDAFSADYVITRDEMPDLK